MQMYLLYSLEGIFLPLPYLYLALYLFTGFSFPVLVVNK